MMDGAGWEKFDYIDMLKSMGCVFYLPLNSDAETAVTDAISGNKITLKPVYDNSTYFQYDDNIKMYKIKNASETTSYIGKITFNVNGFVDNSYTYLGVMYLYNKYTDNASCHSNFMLDATKFEANDGNTTAKSLILYSANSSAGATRNLCTGYYPEKQNIYISCVCTPSFRSFYTTNLNDYSYTKAYTGAVPAFLPDKWQNGLAGDLYLGMPGYTTWGFGKTTAVSNYMVFNRELSQNEIDEIFSTLKMYNNVLPNKTEKQQRRVKSLSIAANDVDGSQTSTKINYTVTWEYRYEDGTKEEKIENGTATSEEFPQNTSATDTVQRTIKFTYHGKTATTTITQGVWSPNSYTINLNSQWQKSSITNPDSDLYDGVYESYANKGNSNSGASMYITINGYLNFKLYIRSDAESSWDYVMVSQLDKILSYNSSYSNTSLVKAHTRGSQSSGTALSNYKLVEFTNIDGGEHTIQIIYRKDGSNNSGTDCGYVLIPKDQ